MEKQRKNTRRNSGITLIALVITIVILLILAGISIAQLTGNGLFDKVKLAKEKSDEAQAKENETLGDYENKIGEYLDNTRETVTIDKEEYESLIPSPIGNNSLLMSSVNGSTSLGELDLKSFTNTFSEQCEDYFLYDSTTGQLICKKAGWYIVKLEIYIDNNNPSATTTSVSMLINDINIGDAKAQCRQNSGLQYDCNTITFYARPEEKIEFFKVTTGVAAYYRNTATILLYKM